LQCRHHCPASVFKWSTAPSCLLSPTPTSLLLLLLAALAPAQQHAAAHRRAPAAPSTATAASRLDSSRPQLSLAPRYTLVPFSAAVVEGMGRTGRSSRPPELGSPWPPRGRSSPSPGVFLFFLVLARVPESLVWVRAMLRMDRRTSPSFRRNTRASPVCSPVEAPLSWVGTKPCLIRPLSPRSNLVLLSHSWCSPRCASPWTEMTAPPWTAPPSAAARRRLS
jgi:hypothetical protein